MLLNKNIYKEIQEGKMSKVRPIEYKYCQIWPEYKKIFHQCSDLGLL